MARPEKRRIDSGEESTGSSRTTPKGTKPGAKPGSSSPSRYTPPTVSAFDQPSPMWVPIVMFSLLGAGFLAMSLAMPFTLLLFEKEFETLVETILGLLKALGHG